VTRVTSQRLQPSTTSPERAIAEWRGRAQSGASRKQIVRARVLPIALDTNGRLKIMTKFLNRLWSEEEGQDIAEYAVMLAVILVIVVGTIRLIGGNANNVFSSVSSSIGS